MSANEEYVYMLNSEDPELRAIELIGHAMRHLSLGAQERVLEYATRRWPAQSPADELKRTRYDEMSN